MCDPRKIAVAVATAYVLLFSDTAHAQFSQFDPFNKNSGAAKFTRGLDPTTQTPTKWTQNVVKAPVAVAGMGVAGGFMTLQGVSNVTRGRPFDSRPPQTNSTLSTNSASRLDRTPPGQQPKPQKPQGLPPTSNGPKPGNTIQVQKPLVGTGSRGTGFNFTPVRLPSASKLPTVHFPKPKSIPIKPSNPFPWNPKPGPLFPGTGFKIPHPKVDIKLPPKPVPKLKDWGAKKDPHIERKIPPFLKPTQGGSGGNQSGGDSGPRGRTEVGGFKGGMILPKFPNIGAPKLSMPPRPKVKFPF